MPSELINTLKGNPFFRYWPQDLLKNMDLVVRDYKQKDTIFNEGELSKYLYFVVSGEVRLFKLKIDGTDFTRKIHRRSEVFGEVGFFDGFSRDCSAEAIINSKVILINKKDFLSNMRGLPSEAWLDLVMFLSNRLRLTSEIKIAGPRGNHKERIIKALHHMASVSETSPIVKITQEKFSQELGISRVQVSKTFNDLKQRKIISVLRGHINVNLEKLAKFGGDKNEN